LRVYVNRKRRYLGVYTSPESLEAYSRFVRELSSAAEFNTPIIYHGEKEITILELWNLYQSFAGGVLSGGRKIDAADRACQSCHQRTLKTVCYVAGFGFWPQAAQSVSGWTRRKIFEPELLQQPNSNHQADFQMGSNIGKNQ
jgi:hypothetical protein